MPWNNDPDWIRLNRDALLFIEEQGGIGVWVWDMEADQHKWSAGLYRVLGLAPFARQPCEDLYLGLVHPDDRLETADWLRLASRSQGLRHRILRPDGEIRWLRSCIRTVHSKSGTPTRLVGVIFDITDLTRGDEAYQREVGLLNAVRDLTNGIVWTTAADGSIVDLVSWRTAVGQHGNNHMGWRRLDDVHPADRDIVRKAWDEALRNRRRYAAEYRARWNGDYALVSSRGSAIHDAAGGILAWVGFSQARPLSQMSLAEIGGDPGPNAGQVRAARAMLGWTGRQLAEKTGLSFSTIRRAETDGRRTVGAPAVETIRKCFEECGLKFAIHADGSYSVTGRGAWRSS